MERIFIFIGSKHIGNWAMIAKPKQLHGHAEGVVIFGADFPSKISLACTGLHNPSWYLELTPNHLLQVEEPESLIFV